MRSTPQRAIRTGSLHHHFQGGAICFAPGNAPPGCGSSRVRIVQLRSQTERIPHPHHLEDHPDTVQ